MTIAFSEKKKIETTVAVRALQTINHRRSAWLEKVHFILQTAVKDSKKKEKVPLAARIFPNQEPSPSSQKRKKKNVIFIEILITLSVKLIILQ